MIYLHVYYTRMTYNTIKKSSFIYLSIYLLTYCESEDYLSAHLIGLMFVNASAYYLQFHFLRSLIFYTQRALFKQDNTEIIKPVNLLRAASM